MSNKVHPYSIQHTVLLADVSQLSRCKCQLTSLSLAFCVTDIAKSVCDLSGFITKVRQAADSRESWKMNCKCWLYSLALLYYIFKIRMNVLPVHWRLAVDKYVHESSACTCVSGPSETHSFELGNVCAVPCQLSHKGSWKIKELHHWTCDGIQI